MSLPVELPAQLPDVFRILDLSGVVLNGVLGGAIARRKNLDTFGFLFIATVSALGGGVLRDVLLQNGPPVALTDPLYLPMAAVGAIVAFSVDFRGRWWRRTSLLLDAAVLGVWSATGTTKALALGLDWVPAILLGVLTAVGGGMIRDVAVGDIPTVFGGNTLYATSALVASGVTLILVEAGQPTIGMLAATVVGATLCVIARWRRWVLPGAPDVTRTVNRTIGAIKTPLNTRKKRIEPEDLNRND